MKLKHWSIIGLFALMLVSANSASGHIIITNLPACDDFFTGGGFIFGTPSGEQGTFGAHGGVKNDELWGGLNYIDHDTGMHVHSTAVLDYDVIDENTRRILYAVTIDGVAGTADVIIQDNGEPGADDVFDILLSTGYHAEGDLGGAGPGGGNIQLHKGDCLTPPNGRKK